MNEKQAIVGPLISLNMLGIPEALGYAAGNAGQMSTAAAQDEQKRRYNIAAGALIPGYTGYHIGRKNKAESTLANLPDHLVEAVKTSGLRPSPALREALASGWWKLAAAVKREQGQPVPEQMTLPGAIQALSYKIAADRANQQKVAAGLAALARVRGER